MNRIVSLHSSVGNTLVFRELVGVEGICTLYHYELILSSPSADIDSTLMMGSPLSVVIETKEGDKYLQGLVTEFGFIAEDTDEQGYYLYRAVIRPHLWYLTQTQNSRVFVEKNVLEIAETLLSGAGISFDNQCTQSYRTYGQSTQYQESDFNYLSRLFEQEGIYYYFTYNKDSHKLILTDQNSTHPAITGNSTISYHNPTQAGAPDKAYFDAWQQNQLLTVSQISLADYNYQLQKSQLLTNTTVTTQSASGTEYFDPYTNYKQPDEAAHYAKVHQEHHQAASTQVTATGTVLTVCAGHHFTLVDHPAKVANAKHLITEAQFYLKEAGYTTGHEQSSYRTKIIAIPFETQYRPIKRTPKPQVVGTQAAIITGPAGEEVYTNDYGDIKLQFHWDRYGPHNENSSAWIRVIQASAGVGFGSINIPRIGEEVLVDFINGDVDRPIVIGRLYNVANPPPWGYPIAAKQSGIKSKSFNSPPENFNEFKFDDTEGAELVNFQAQKDLTSLIKNDETRHIQNNRTTTVDVDETVMVHGKRTETVDKDETITIHQNRTETVDKDETITIHQNRKERVDKDETISIGGNRTETVEGEEKILIQGNRDKTVDKNDTLTIKQNQKHTIQKNHTLTVNKNSNETIKIAKSVTVGTVYATQVGTVMNTAVGMMQSEEVGIKKTTMVGKSYNIIAGDVFTLTVGNSSLTLNQDGTIILQGKHIQIIGDSQTTIIGQRVDINPEGVGSSQTIENQSIPTQNDESCAKNPDYKTLLSKEQESELMKALEQQKNALQKKKNAMEIWDEKEQALFKRSFGTDEPKAVEIVKKRLDHNIAMNNEILQRSLSDKYSLNGQFYKVFCDIAQVDPSPNSNPLRWIGLSDKFWQLPLEHSVGMTENSKVHTLIHEISHFDTDKLRGTDDSFENYRGGVKVYGYEASQILATSAPHLAISHADSIAYYFLQ